MSSPSSFKWVALAVTTVTLCCSDDARGGELCYKLFTSEVKVGSGDGVDVSLDVGDGCSAVEGWSLGLCHDPAVLQVGEVRSGLTTLTVNDGEPPEFHDVDLWGEGWTAAAVINRAGDASLPPGSSYHLYTATYHRLCGGPAELTFCDTLPGLQGEGRTRTVVIAAGEESTVSTVPGSLSTKSLVPFLRGDCNADGSVNIADAVYVVGFLFRSGPESPCLDACDANADGFTDLSDTVYLVNFRFLGGSPPPPPFPACGAPFASNCESSWCPECAVVLEHPSFVSVGAPTRASAASVSSCGTCRWDVTYSGQGRVQIENDNCSATITGVTPSSAIDDVKITVHHSSTDAECTAETTLTVIGIEATNIKFDHEGPDTSTGDALNIRLDAERDLGHMGNGMGPGEWIKGERNEPALYVAGNEVTCQVRFSVRGPPIRSATLQARVADGELFGGIARQTIQFRGGISEPEFVTMRFDRTTPLEIRKDVGTLEWSATEINGRPSGSLVVDRSGPHTCYNILDVPQAPWYTDEAHHAWVTAVDSAIFTVAQSLVTEKNEAVAIAADAIHNSFGLVYDTVSGIPSYCNKSKGTVTFDLTGFILKSEGNVVNCYDCAAAVTTYGALFGANAEYTYIQPFGYLLKTHLIGKSDCNNPFPDEGTYLPDLCVTDFGNPFCESDKCFEDLRSGFGNHSFVKVTTFGVERVFDACAGPHLGTESVDSYLANSIDDNAACEATFAGDVMDIIGNNQLIVE